MVIEAGKNKVLEVFLCYLIIGSTVGHILAEFAF